MIEIDKLDTADDVAAAFEQLVERRDDLVDFALQDFRDTLSELASVESDIDVELADRNPTTVEELVDTARRLIQRLDELDELVRLAAFPATPTGSGSAEPGDLPTVRPAALPAEHDDTNLGGNVEDCAARIRYLLRIAVDKIWPQAVGAAEEGDAGTLDDLVTLANQVANELGETYQLWFMWLGQLSAEDPGSAGVAGEMTMALGAFLTEQRYRHRGAV